MALVSGLSGIYSLKSDFAANALFWIFDVNPELAVKALHSQPLSNL
ncbi:hypothetical protein [Spartinivicinus ruber]|nr:hypothetical protein [Spartinivicinus ruber]